MNRLGEKSLKTLEYYEILERLAAQAASEAAKEKCRALRPLDDREQAELWMRQTTDAKDRMVRQGSPSFGGIREVGAILIRADRGGTLNPRELLSVASLLQTARRALAYEAESEEKSALSPIFGLLSGNRSLEEAITTAIVSEEEIADGASPELLSIRRELRRISGRVRETLNRMISGERSKYLQETIITQRNGRFVVPVKAEHRGDVPGLVHDTSSTGATVFVEPQQVVEINNQIKVLEGCEEAEIERILASLSAEVSMYKGAIEQDYDALTTLDFIFARAKLSFEMNAAAPSLLESGSRVRLLRARHPLLDKDKAVAIDIAIGDDYDTLVITGPNTGGKTVSLKTLGLLSLMAASGLHIPASEESEIGLFEHVYADIGDEQSIEQSLSTFSAHMVNIVEILKEADRHSLVLFDELGAGTDPVEGAALAIAVIQHVRRLGAKVAATTHYAELKTFAMTTAGVENASCEFDVETLAPTYRLLIGIPGKSNAFAISRRLGLPEDVIAAAQGQRSGESGRFEDILTRLEEKRQALEKREQEADRLLRQREEDARRAREFREQMERAKDNARSRGEAEAKRILRDARTAADQVFQELSEMRKAQAKAERMLNENEARAALRRTLNEAEEAVSRRDARQEPIPKPSRPIRAGDLVEIPGVKTPAEVVSVGKDGTLQLKAGILKMKAKVDEVRLIEDDERAARKKTPSVTIRQNADRALRASAARELDIRGMETLEAESVVENFISAAVMGKLETVTIIHGKGTGALRKAVHDILRRNKAVKSFRLGVYGEGESGVTVVTLK